MAMFDLSNESSESVEHSDGGNRFLRYRRLQDTWLLEEKQSESPISVEASVSLMKKYVMEWEEVSSFMAEICGLSNRANLNLRTGLIGDFIRMESQLRICQQKLMRKVWKMRCTESYELASEDSLFLPIDFRVHRTRLSSDKHVRVGQYCAMAAPQISTDSCAMPNLSENRYDSKIWSEYKHLAGIWAIGRDVQRVVNSVIHYELYWLIRTDGTKYAEFADKMEYCKRKWSILIDYYEETYKDLLRLDKQPYEIDGVLNDVCYIVKRNRKFSRFRDVEQLTSKCNQLAALINNSFLAKAHDYSSCLERVAALQRTIIDNRNGYYKSVLLHCQLFGGLIGGVYEFFQREDLTLEHVNLNPDVPVLFNYALNFDDNGHRILKDFAGISNKLDKIDIRLQRQKTKGPQITNNVIIAPKIQLGPINLELTTGCSVNDSNIAVDIEMNPQIFDRLFPGRFSDQNDFHIEYFLFSVASDREIRQCPNRAKARLFEQHLNRYSLQKLQSYYKRRRNVRNSHHLMDANIQEILTTLDRPYVPDQLSIFHYVANVCREIHGIIVLDSKTTNNQSSSLIVRDQIEQVAEIVQNLSYNFSLDTTSHLQDQLMTSNKENKNYLVEEHVLSRNE